MVTFFCAHVCRSSPQLAHKPFALPTFMQQACVWGVHRRCLKRLRTASLLGCFCAGGRLVAHDQVSNCWFVAQDPAAIAM